MERHFFEELKVLREKLFQMGLFVEASIEKAVDSFLSRKAGLAESVFEEEKAINALEIEIDERGHSLFALAQPVAGDLRLLTMILKINTDLERIGDHAVNIAQRSLSLLKEPRMEIVFSFEKMAREVQQMLRDALDCFMSENLDLARHVLQSDDKIDDLNNHLYREMTSLMECDPSAIQRALCFVMIGHNLERVADLANNIAEDTIYYKEGREVRHHFETT